jgi:hypothetical protein
VSLVDQVREKVAERQAAERLAIPRDVEDRLRRGRREMRKTARKRRLCQMFLDGEHYYYLDNEGALNALDVNPGVRSGKPRHRIRPSHNLIRPLVDAKVSSSTTRVPGYEVNPATTDPEDFEAAALAQKIIRQGWDAWGLEDARVDAATLAIGGGGKAYALPYFDPMVGPFRLVPGEEGEPERLVGEGEIKVMVLNGNEAYCEPGTKWKDSRWYCVEHARPISEVTQMEGFYGIKLSADATSADLPTDRPDEDMVMVTLYFERPSPKYPQGRMLTMANGKQICPEGPYPLRQAGQAIDAPCLHRLVFRADPRRDDDLGLTWELIDFQRGVNDCDAKILELKNHALVSQLLAQEGTIRKAPTDEPGAITYYVGAQPPTWRDPPNPALLAQLQSIRAGLVEDMRWVAADAEIDVAPNVAIGTAQTAVAQSENRWSQFIRKFAKFDADVARHCLLLAQEHYAEERLLKVRGRLGWEPEASFRGADIQSQTDVTVLPATIETRSRNALLQQLAWIQANFPGYIRPEIAIEIVLYGTSPESVIDSFEADKARANEIIQRIRDGSIMNMPDRSETMMGPPDPLTGRPTMSVGMVPGWMPREFDNVDVQMYVMETWLKSSDASRLSPELYEVAMLVYQGFKQLQSQQQAEAAAAQTAQAMALGEANAARPQSKPMPSTPSPTGDGQ